MPLLISCASKIPITKIPSEQVKKIESDTHSINFERMTNSIPQGKLIETVSYGAMCEMKLGGLVGGGEVFARGPGVPLYFTKAEGDALGTNIISQHQRSDWNLLAFKTMLNVLKENNIKTSNKSDLRLTALITDIKMNNCIPWWHTGKWKGEALVKIKWTLYSKFLKKDILTLDIESFAEETETSIDALEKITVNLYKNNVNQLINNSDFRNKIKISNPYIEENLPNNPSDLEII
jgi:hypothetical protein